MKQSLLTFFTLSEGHRQKLLPPIDCQAPLCYMTVIHIEAVTAIVEEIYDETVIFKLFWTLSEGHRAKLTSPLDWQTPLCYMSVIYMKAVTMIVKSYLMKQ